MKFIVSIFLVALLSYAAGLYLPWWSIAIAAFLVSLLIYQRPAIAFLSGFAALFILWGAMAWFRSMANEHILASKMAMLILKSNSPGTLIFISTLIGAITAGLAALSGSLIRRIKESS